MVVVTVVLGVLLMGWHVVVVHHARGIVQRLWPALMLHVVVRGHGVPAHVLVLPIIIGPWAIVMGLSSIDTEALQRWSWAAGCRSQSGTRRTAAWPLQSPPLVCGRTGTGPCARTARRRSPASATPAKTGRRAGGGIGDGRLGWFGGPRGVGQRLQAWPPQSAGKESSLPLHRQSMLCVGCSDPPLRPPTHSGFGRDDTLFAPSRTALALGLVHCSAVPYHLEGNHAPIPIVHQPRSTLRRCAFLPRCRP